MNKNRKVLRSLRAVESLEERLALTLDAVEDSYIVFHGSDLNDDVLANDVDAGAAILETGPTNGTLIFNGDGTFTYTPDANYIGSDPFDYSATSAAGVNILMDSSTSWNYLHPTDGTDPQSQDSDFNTTWFNQGLPGGNDDYNGPAFNGTGSGLFGYGGISFGPTTEDIGEPASGDRYSAYFTSTFDLGAISVAEINSLDLTILADDGAFIYINGQLAEIVNIDDGVADTYFAVASDATDTETDPVNLTIAPSFLVEGVNTISVSVHNKSNSSSDLGFQLDLEATTFDTATVTLDVQDGGIAPVLVDSAYTIDEDTILDTLSDVAYTNPLADSGLFDGLGDPFDAFTLITVDDTTGAAGSLFFIDDPAFADVGNFVFTPAAGYHGHVSFTYTVTDDDGESNEATVSIFVAPVNDAPVANSSGYTIDKNQTLNSTFTVDEKTAAGSTWRYSDTNTDWGVVNPNWNQIGFNPDDPDGTGTLPAWGTGAAELGYGEFFDDDADPETPDVQEEITLLDFGGDEDNKFTTYYFQSTFDLTAPELASTTHLFINLKRDDGAAVYINGVEVILDNLSTIHTHDTFSDAGSADDGNGFQLFVVPVSSMPANTLVLGENVIAAEVHQVSLTSSDISFDLSLGLSSDFDEVGNGSVLGSASDGQRTGLTAVLETDVTNGTLTLNPDGSFEYIPIVNFFGSDSFTFFADDGTEQSALPATVSITVNNTVSNPVAVDDNYTVLEDTVLVVDNVANGLLANEPGVGSGLEVDSFTQPANGSVSVNADGTFTYTPTPNFNGPDTFTYTIEDTSNGLISALATVTITVNGSVDPLVVNNTSFNTSEGQSVIVSSLGSPIVSPAPFDEEFFPTDVIINTPPTNGTVTTDGFGTFTYEPNVNFHGGDSSNFTVISGKETILPTGSDWDYFHPLDAVDPSISDADFNTTWFTRQIPATSYSGADWDGAIANADSGNGPATFEYGGINFGSATQLTTPDEANRFTAYFTTTFEIADLGTVAHLTANVLGDDAAFIYLNGFEVGRVNVAEPTDIDTYDYRTDVGGDEDNLISVDLDLTGVTLNEGTNYLAVSIHQRMPDEDDGDPSSDLGFDMSLDLAYSVDVTATVTVSEDTGAPTGFDDAYTIVEDESLSDNVMVNANGVETGPDITAVVDSGPSNAASFTLNPDGSFDYTPILDFFGTDSFTYLLNDSGNAVNSIPITVTIDVTSVNDDPVGVDDAYTIDVDETLTTSPGTVGASLIALNSIWSYDDSNTDWTAEMASRGLADWTDPSFDTTDPDQLNTGGLGELPAFSSGQAPLGYGNGNETTTIDFGGDEENKFPTYYFIREFSILDQAALDAIGSDVLLTTFFDDGGAVYLNGVEISRSFLLDSATHSDHTYRSTLDPTVETPSVIDLASLPGGNPLAIGNNVVAVEIHQVELDSSDVSFNLALEVLDVVDDTRVLANDSDSLLENDVLFVELVTGPSQHDDNGGASPFTLNADGSFTYVPTTGFEGQDTFTYSVTDRTVTISPITVTINVEAPNIVGDIDGNDQVDLADLLLMKLAFGTSDSDADLDGSGIVDRVDMRILLGNYGLIAPVSAPPAAAAASLVVTVEAGSSDTSASDLISSTGQPDEHLVDLVLSTKSTNHARPVVKQTATRRVVAIDQVHQSEVPEMHTRLRSNSLHRARRGHRVEAEIETPKD